MHYWLVINFALECLYFEKGRETKTRSTKKKYLKGKNDSDDEGEEEFTSISSSSFDLEFMSIDEIVKVLREQESVSEAPDNFFEEIAARLHKYYYNYIYLLKKYMT